MTNLYAAFILRYTIFFRGILLVAMMTCCVSVLGAGAAYAAPGALGGRPAHPQESNKRTRSIFVHTLEAGKSVEEGVLIVNNSETRQTANIYAVDATVTSSGSLTCRQRVEEKKDVGNWISLAESSVTLEPGEDKIIPFTIAVPDGDVDVGEHDGCIVIEPMVDEDNDSGSGGIRIRTRSAIRVAVTIPGDIKKDLKFESFDIHAEKGNYYYNVSLSNTGNVSLDTNVRVRLSDIFGKLVFENGGQYPVIPRANLDLSFVDEHPPFLGGWYWVDVSASYDGSLTNGIGAQSNVQTVTKDWDRQLLFIMPSATGVIIILGILGLLLGIPAYIAYRIVTRRRMLHRGKEHVVNPGETLKAIAEHYGVTWKTLATLNKLKPPYDVELGSTLVIPQKAAKKGKAKTKQG